MAGLPMGTVTFLFTDLEGSTRLWEEHPEAMRSALARHDEILRNVVEGHGGVVVKTTGDGLHAAFGDAEGALRAAAAGQRGMAVEPWVGVERLRVRMGVHTGAAELRADDYFGPALNRAARLMAVAHGGQVLVSLVTEELARDVLPEDLDLVELGEHLLRDLSRSERIFQLVGPGLDAEFAPLHSLGRSMGNVVVPATSFLGRTEELVAVSALLEQSRLVTLLGVGGVGKTRLALQVADEVAVDFEDGAWFCDLASVSDEDGVAMAVATSLGVVPRGGLPVLDAVLEFLQAKALLVVLDNCEHLIDGIAAFAQEASSRCPRLRLLATSREALALEGERLWPVRPLRVPDDTLDVEEALSSAPVRLFVDRVQMLRPEFRVDAENLRPVLEICRHLDGIPLALELAAARATSLSPSEIAERLDRRFALLSGSRRRGVSRHETLRAAVDWSYDLLDEPERAVLARVSVFSGGFTLEAAELVTEGGGEDETWDLLSRLVDKSLLTVEEHHGWTRYRLLETIRQYAFERLGAIAADTVATRDRHLEYFVEFAEQAGQGLRTVDEALWTRRLTPEAENLRSALGWAIETEEVAGALRIVSAFSRQAFWAIQARLLAGLVEATLDLDNVAEHPLYPTALAVSGELARANGDYDRAVELADEAVRLSREADPARWIAECALGNVALWTARDDPATHFDRALAAGRAAENPADIAMAQGLAATGLSFRGAEYLTQARAAAEEAVELATAAECPSIMSGAYFSLGYILVLSGDPSAGEWLRRSLTGGGENTFNRSGALSMLALHHLRHGTPTEALEALEASVRDVGYRADRSSTSTVLDLAIPLFIRYGDPVTAAELRAALERGALPRIRRAGVTEGRRAAAFAVLDERLDPDELAAAEARGIAMTYDQVLAHSLERVQALSARVTAEPNHERGMPTSPRGS